jgi:adenosine kinase
MKITITGSIAFDYLMSFPGRFAENIVVDQIENISLSFLVESLKRQRGGTAPNIAYTLALLNGRPKVMATAGQDFDEYRAWLETQGVDTSDIVQIADDYCASFFVNTDRDQNQIASFYTGAMAHAGQLSYAEHAPETELTIISPNDPGAMKKYVAECKENNIPYIYDPSQQTIWLTGDDLRFGFDGCYLLTVNEYELSLIQQKTGLSEAEIRERVGGLLVTKAEKGALLSVNGEEYYIPSVAPRQLVEPTGAGDAFRAGLMRGMQLGLPWSVAGRMGALCATYVLEQLGTQRHHFTREEFVTRYRQNFDDEGALDLLLA